MNRQIRSLRSDDGTTLIEVIVTVAIMAVAVVAIVGGAATSIFMSTVHREQASAQTILRSYADAVIASPAWPGCFSATSANVAAQYGPSAVTFTVAPAYGAQFMPAATAVQFWNGSSFQATCTADTGIQTITLQVSSHNGNESTDVVKRCSGQRVSGSCP